MRRFIIYISCFLLATSVLLLSCEVYSIYTSSYGDKVNGWEVYAALKRSKQHKKVKRVLLGDSVGMQMYPCDGEYDNMVSLTCNQAISFAGFYFLLNNFFEENKDDLPEEVILLCHPYTLGNNLDRYAFHYFLKPFYTVEYKPLITDSLQMRIQEIPFYWLSQFPFVKTTNYTFHYILPEVDYIAVSPITKEYLPRIIQLIEEHNVSLRFESVPIRQSIIKDVEERWQNAIVAGELQIFSPYLDSFSDFQIMPDSCYRGGEDKVHFNGANVPHDYLHIQ